MSVGIGWWLLAFGILLIVIFLVIGIGLYIRNTQVIVTPPISNMGVVSSWSKPVMSTNPDKNTCQVYTFPSLRLDTGDVLPSNPAYTNAMLNMQGNGVPGVCYDNDQIAAQQVTRTCTSKGNQGSDLTMCITLDGKRVGVGYKEDYFADCLTRKVPKCPGELSVISLDHQQAPSGYCMSLRSDGTIFTEECDITKEQMIFRITRTNWGIDPRILTPDVGKSGLLTKIEHRSTGMCLSAGESIGNVPYVPDRYNPCVGLGPNGKDIAAVLPATQLVLKPCDNGVYPGYEWVFMPSFIYNAGSQIPETTFAAMVYIGNLDSNDIPFNREYKGSVGLQALLTYFVDKGAMAIYFQTNEFSPTLPPMLTPITRIQYAYCVNRPFINQYVNLSSYETMYNYQVCIAELSDPAACIPL